MVFTGASKYFIITFLLFACGYFCDQASSDNYHYVYLIANRDNGFFLSELNSDIASALNNNFSKAIINVKTGKATVYGSIRKCINILGNLGYRIYNYSPKLYSGEWILEKKTVTKEHVMTENLTTKIPPIENTSASNQNYIAVVQ